MADKLYEMMDWPEIEAVVYSEENAPRNILGPRMTGDGVLVQCFFPERTQVSVKVLSDEKTYPMVMEVSLRHCCRIRRSPGTFIW